MGFVVLVVLVQLLRGGSTQPSALGQHFAANPPEAGSGDISLPVMPSAVAERARNAVAKLAGGKQAPALTPVATSGSLRVQITNLQAVGKGLHIGGEVANVGTAPFTISLAQFRFLDERGTVYNAENSGSTSVAPGAHVPLDLTLPIASPRQLTLEVAAPGQPLLRMTLVQSQ
ncbi:MAG: hypothetical protein NVSMB42_00690 [Herpetosiphon sp.]